MLCAPGKEFSSVFIGTLEALEEGNCFSCVYIQGNQICPRTQRKLRDTVGGTQTSRLHGTLDLERMKLVATNTKSTKRTSDLFKKNTKRLNTDEIM